VSLNETLNKRLNDVPEQICGHWFGSGTDSKYIRVIASLQKQNGGRRVENCIIKHKYFSDTFGEFQVKLFFLSAREVFKTYYTRFLNIWASIKHSNYSQPTKED